MYSTSKVCKHCAVYIFIYISFSFWLIYTYICTIVWYVEKYCSSSILAVLIERGEYCLRLLVLISFTQEILFFVLGPMPACLALGSKVQRPKIFHYNALISLFIHSVPSHFFILRCLPHSVTRRCPAPR